MANPLRLFFHHDDPAVLGLVSKRGDAADPQPLALGGGDLVANALGLLSRSLRQAELASSSVLVLCEAVRDAVACCYRPKTGASIEPRTAKTGVRVP